AGIDREGAEHRGKKIAGAEPDEVAVEVRLVAGGRGGGREGGDRGRGLHHHHDCDDQRQREEGPQVVEGPHPRGRQPPPAGRAPSTATPRPSRSKTSTASVAATMPTSAPGMRALIRSVSSMMASTPRPIAVENGLAAARPPAIAPTWAERSPAPLAIPNRLGSCDTTICTATPARKPVMTGVDSRWAIQPSLSSPATRSRPPTGSARARAAAGGGAAAPGPPGRAAPAAARVASIPAKIGVMVESAPAVSTRLAPKAAKPRVAPMKA